ncbi:MAG: glycosyltransferase, partial [Fuerstiella sp.]
IPIVPPFHTLLNQPGPVPRRLIRELAARSKAVVVMTKTAARMLTDVFGVSDSNVQVIPHGVPFVPFKRDPTHRGKLGLAGRQVICTFGLINPGKGLEHMIRAMPQIVNKCPEALYLIVGVTHPQVKQQKGEAYRESLIDLADTLGVGQHVRFVNEYLSLPELLAYLQSCDVFVTPYPGKDQIASGTMAYALAGVGAIVSTPYLYAEEVLAGGRGLLVPFADSAAMSAAALRLLTDPQLLADIRHRAYEYARSMFWPNVGRKYLDLFTRVVRDYQGSAIRHDHVNLSIADENQWGPLLEKGI